MIAKKHTINGCKSHYNVSLSTEYRLRQGSPAQSWLGTIIKSKKILNSKFLHTTTPNNVKGY